MKTAAGKADVSKRLTNAKSSTLWKIKSFKHRNQQFVGRLLSRLGRDGEEFVEKADSDDITQMQEMKRAMPDGGRITVSEARLWSYRLAELVGDDDISSKEFARYLDNLETMDHKTRQELVELTVESDTASPAQSVKFVNDISEIKHIDGADEIIDDAVKGNSGGFRGAVFEADYAARNAEDVVELQADAPGVSRPGDIDVMTEENGKTVGYELKSSSSKDEIGEIASGYKELIEKGVVDDYKIVFKHDPSDELKKYMESNGIEYEVA